MKIYASKQKITESYPIINIEVYADHPIFWSNNSEIAAAIDLTKYDLPKGEMIAKDKARVTGHMIDDFDSFVERVEDLCEEDYGLILTYRNVSDDHSYYYNYLATDSEGNIIVDIRLRLRISNHSPKRSKEQRRHKDEELESERLHELLSDYEISKLTKYPKIIVVNDERFETYEDAFEAVSEIIEDAVAVMHKNEKHRPKVTVSKKGKADEKINKGNFETEVANYFERQAGIYIDDYRNEDTRSFDKKRSMINLDWDSIPKTKQREIQQAVAMHYSPYKLIDNGAWMKAIVKD